MSASETSTVDDALTHLARVDGPRVLAVLAKRLNNLDLADDAVQDGLVDATRSWPRTGIPDNPGGWLMAVAKRRANDRLRANGAAHRREKAAGYQTFRDHEAPPMQPSRFLDADSDTLTDERLRLMFLCCHPALDSDSQVALTLRLVGGLTTSEISSSFLLPEPTLAQRIVRAKRKIRDANIPLSIPQQLEPRLGVVLSVLYLVFNEGYLSRGADQGAVRTDLVQESLRLVDLLAVLIPDHSEIEGLRALQLFALARIKTRFDEEGELVLLENQNRQAWNGAAIAAGNKTLARALSRMRPGPYQVQAMIAALHTNAAHSGDTNWPRISELYRQLESMTGSAVVRLNRAVAVAMAEGPDAGLALVDSIAGLDNYHLLHSTRAELLLRSGDVEAARKSFELAELLATNPVEKRHLARRASSISL